MSWTTYILGIMLMRVLIIDLAVISATMVAVITTTPQYATSCVYVYSDVAELPYVEVLVSNFNHDSNTLTPTGASTPQMRTSLA